MISTVLNSSTSIFKLAEDFVQSRKNANNLALLVEFLASKSNVNSKLTNCSILALQTIFTHALAERNRRRGEDCGDAENKYQEWIFSKYEEAIPLLLNVLKGTKHPYSVREQAMVTYVNLIKLESLYVNKPDSKDVFCLPKLKYYNLLKTVVSSKKAESRKSKVQTKLLNRLSEFTALHDVALQTWVSCVTLTKCDKKVPTETKISNILQLLKTTAIPSLNARDKNPDQLIFPNRAKKIPRKFFSKKLPHAIDGVWDNIKKWHHTESTLHETLLLLIEKIMDNLSQPKMLTDFLMTSLNYGGALSLLSLQGIFNLIQKHNIEYPDVYSKLYSLFTPDILRTKYKQRLFFLSDLFLSSTHIPESLVAAFAKRLSRLALTASTTDALIIIRFVGNLLIRHKSVQKMIHNPEGGYVDCDPYVEDEADPCNSKAIHSCLWELKSLQNHLVPGVAIAARFIDDKLPTVEWDLADVLETKYCEVFEKEMNKKAKEITLNFIPPTNEVLEKLKRTF
ncbi:nucleolar complex protein 4 homolog B [Cloeon dipterum]|uniref:nucleolar complex protein 4 homolog B n=1 Tax=Cloeon dipterum TaxID=197152 RepID=UPI00321FB276